MSKQPGAAQDGVRDDIYLNDITAISNDDTLHLMCRKQHQVVYRRINRKTARIEQQWTLPIKEPKTYRGILTDDYYIESYAVNRQQHVTIYAFDGRPVCQRNVPGEEVTLLFNTMRQQLVVIDGKTQIIRGYSIVSANN